MDTSSKPLTVMIEKHVPFLAGILEPYANVLYPDTDEITPELLKNVNAMIIRSRTKCNESLLADSKCSLIVTATAGTDHIDKEWCSRRGIGVVNCPGSNAPAVAQYVLSSIVRLSNRPLEEYTIGIVGVGNIGGIVERWCRALGMTVLICDPPRQRAEEDRPHYKPCDASAGKSSRWSTIDEIAAKSDIITFHTPLNPAGHPDRTYHLADENFFASCRRRPVIINASRGAVVDNQALKQALKDGLVSVAALDVWENEPDIDRDLLQLAAIATTHIAGYSHEGKVRASQMALDAVTTFFYLPRLSLQAASAKACAKTVSPLGVMRSYDPMPMTAELKARPEDFEKIRNTYPFRNEAPEGEPAR